MPEFSSRASFVKICGVTSLVDAETVASSGADALGLILTASKRRVTPASADAIARAVAGRLVRVGVVRDVTTAEALALIEGVDVDVLQVHGHLGDDLLAALRARGLGVIKALSVGSAEFARFDEAGVDAVLVDGPEPGSGVAHAWDDLVNRAFTRPVIAAGGLTALNVGTVIDELGVWGVDVATGVERAPGEKDPRRVLDFVREARAHLAKREVPGG